MPRAKLEGKIYGNSSKYQAFSLTGEEVDLIFGGQYPEEKTLFIGDRRYTLIGEGAPGSFFLVLARDEEEETLYSILGTTIAYRGEEIEAPALLELEDPVEREIDPGMLEEHRRPSKNLNQNSYPVETREERIGILVSSRLFTFVASVLTLGLYYLYYLFCLEQYRDSPLKPSGKGPEKYSMDRVHEADPTFQEAKAMGRSLAGLACSTREKLTKRQLAKALGVNLLGRLRMHLRILLSNLLHLLERLVLQIFRQDLHCQDKKDQLLQKSLRDWFRFDQQIRAFLKRKVQGLSGDYYEDPEFVDALVIGMSNRKPRGAKDHYLTFVFYVTYLLLSVFSLGAFPIYHLVLKNRWSDFRNISRHREHASRFEFDQITERLLGTTGNIEYSYLLLSRNRLPLNLNFFSDAFRTKAFSSRTTRGNLVTFLMVITLGLFGVLVLGKNLFDKEELRISFEDSRPTDYSKIGGRISKFKYFMADLVRDMRVSSRIAARRISTINGSINNLLEPDNDNDYWISRFMGLISSELYFWLFSFLSILGGFTFIYIYIHWHPTDFYLSYFFWTIASGLLLFLSLFTRHIRLLFT